SEGRHSGARIQNPLRARVSNRRCVRGRAAVLLREDPENRGTSRLAPAPDRRTICRRLQFLSRRAFESQRASLFLGLPTTPQDTDCRISIGDSSNLPILATSSFS